MYSLKYSAFGMRPTIGDPTTVLDAAAMLEFHSFKIGKVRMAGSQLSIRIDLANGERIGPGKVDLLEAIRSTGSISAAARTLGMSYRRAWLLVEDINAALCAPAVAAATGGRRGGGARVTAVGEKVIALYRSIERTAHASVRKQCRAVHRLARKPGVRSRA